MANLKLVTDEAVRLAIADIEARGQQLTTRAIYDHIGGGSMTTIAAKLREYRKEIEQKQITPAEPISLPPALEEVMRRSAAEMWRVSQQECQIIVTAVKAKAQSDVAEVVAERDVNLGELEAVTEELQQANVRFAELKASTEQDRDALEGQLRQQAEELRSVTIAANSAQTRATELDKHLAELQADIRAERLKRDQAEDARRGAELALSETKTDLARAQEQILGLTARAEAHQAELQRLQENHAHSLKEQKEGSAAALEQAHSRVQQLEAETQRHVKAATEAAALIGHLQGELSGAKTLAPVTAETAKPARQKRKTPRAGT